MKPQAALINYEIGPCPRQQLLLADDSGGTVDEYHEDVERATSQFDLYTVFLQQSFCRAKLERTERNDVPTRSQSLDMRLS